MSSVLCAVCETVAPTVDAAACASCGGALVLHDRFVIERLLGAGGQSRVYGARDRQTGGEVAIKIMALSRTRDFKSVELFRRSAGVLAGLSHPSVPRLVDYFEELRPTTALYCLAHELVDGETLAQQQARGVRWNESDVRGFAREMLTVLTYLHGLSPPVIHRDIKPSNIMQRRVGGSLVLIDFDLVRDVLRPEGGSTMSAGTAGFTPLEQYTGDATPATDLYALGVTLAVLMSRRAPLELRRAGEQRLDIATHVNADATFVHVLERMTEPDAADRYQRASEVLAALAQPDATLTSPTEATTAPLPHSGVLMRERSIDELFGSDAPTASVAPPPSTSSSSSSTTADGVSADDTHDEAKGDWNDNFWLRVGIVAGLAALGGLFAAIENSKSKPPPPPTITAPTTPPVRQKTKHKPVLHTPSTDLDPTRTEALLVGTPWETKLDGIRARYTFAPKGKRFVATRTTFTEDGRTRDTVDYDVQLYPLGSFALRRKFQESGVTVGEAIFGDVTTTHDELVGVVDKRYNGLNPDSTPWLARAVAVKTP